MPAGAPLKLSTGPDVLAPVGAANVVCNAAQLVKPAATQVVTPPGPTSRFVPETEAMFVATSAPIGAPAQPGSDDPALQMFGLCMVSAPSAEKFSPTKEASPVETGNGRPPCGVLSMPNVQLFRTVRSTGVCRRLSVSATKLKLTKWRRSFWAEALSRSRGASGFPGSERPKKSSPSDNVWDHA